MRRRSTPARPGDRVRSIEVAMRRARLLIGLLIVGTALTGRDRSTTELGLGASIALLGFLLLSNAASFTAERSDVRTERRLVLWQLGIDICVAAAVVIATGVQSSSSWAILLVPVLHSALRYQMTGVITTWGVFLGFFLGRAIWLWKPRAGLGQLEVIVQPLSILLLVGISIGYLAGQLTEELLDQRSLNLEAAERTSLLAAVTAATRRMTQLETRSIAEATVAGLVRLGYDAGDVWQLDDDGRWQLLAASDSPLLDELGPPADGELEAIRSGRSALWTAAEGPISGVLRMPFAFTRIVVRALSVDESFRWAPRLQATDILLAQTGHAFGLDQRLRQLEAMRRRLAHDASHDALTGLLNRAGLASELTVRLERLAPDQVLPVMLVDLDGFKAVNDTLGHETGDDVLREMARTMADLVPPGTLLARLGGDEFVVALPHLVRDGFEQATAETRRMDLQHGLVAERGEEQVLRVTGSIGLHLAGHGQSTDACLAAADASMYDEKRRRRMHRMTPR